MSKDFNKELTIYIWPTAHFKYPKGHAAFKVRAENSSISINFGETSDGKDHQRTNKQQRDLTKGNDFSGRERLRQQSQQDNKLLFQTAVRKIKIPFVGSDSPWGLILWDLFEYEQRAFRDQRDYPSSFSYVADQLRANGADSYVPPRYETFRGSMWDALTLEQWARAIRARIDELNQKNEQLTPIIARNVNVRNRPAVRHLMTAQDWKTLSNKDVGGSIIRSERIRKLDRLVARNQESARNVTETIRILATMLDIIADYMNERGDTMRSNAVLALGKQVIEVVKDGCHDYRIANWDPYKPGKQYYGELDFVPDWYTGD